jgi:hypothetical protein
MAEMNEQNNLRKTFDPLSENPTTTSLQGDVEDLEDQANFLQSRRITQTSLVPGAVKQRHIGEGVRFIASGIEADLPTPAPPTQLGTAIFFATDTKKLWIWDGKVWKFVQLA